MASKAIRTLNCSIVFSLMYHNLLHCCQHAGSPNVTSLIFNSSSNILTCTSTGGPATVVTWKRDGSVITLNATYQQTKRVVDSVAGTYQTVLTIDHSVDQSNIVGTYNCMVENVRGKSSMTAGNLPLNEHSCYTNM